MEINLDSCASEHLGKCMWWYGGVGLAFTWQLRQRAKWHGKHTLGCKPWSISFQVPAARSANLAFKSTTSFVKECNLAFKSTTSFVKECN